MGDGPGAAAAAAKPYVDTVVQEIRATAANWKITTRTPVSDGRYNHGAEKDPTHSTIMTPSPDTPSPPTTRKATTVPGYAFPSRVPSAAFRGDGEVVEEEDVPCGSGGGCGGVKTLFFGGGTPSLCPPELVKVLIDTVQECFGISADAEISMEMDPGTFDEVFRICMYFIRSFSCVYIMCMCVCFFSMCCIYFVRCWWRWCWPYWWAVSNGDVLDAFGEINTQHKVCG